MTLEQQWCANPTCQDFGRVNVGNIRVFSYTEQRTYCTTCRRTFSADHGTFFETLRSEQATVVETLALLTERNSLHAAERLTHHDHNTILHWVDLAGQHAAQVSRALICNLHLTQAQIDELWTFVKKTGAPATRRSTGSGGYVGLACSRLTESPTGRQSSQS